MLTVVDACPVGLNDKQVVRVLIMKVTSFGEGTANTDFFARIGVEGLFARACDTLELLAQDLASNRDCSPKEMSYQFLTIDRVEAIHYGENSNPFILYEPLSSAELKQFFASYVLAVEARRQIDNTPPVAPKIRGDAWGLKLPSDELA